MAKERGRETSELGRFLQEHADLEGRRHTMGRLRAQPFPTLTWRSFAIEVMPCRSAELNRAQWLRWLPYGLWPWSDGINKAWSKVTGLGSIQRVRRVLLLPIVRLWQPTGPSCSSLRHRGLASVGWLFLLLLLFCFFFFFLWVLCFFTPLLKEETIRFYPTYFHTGHLYFSSNNRWGGTWCRHAVRLIFVSLNGFD